MSHECDEEDVGPGYKDLKRIAEGAYGRVYTATDIQEDKPCVLKVESLSTKHPSLEREAIYLEHLKRKTI